jgi:hypothetical protein
MAEHVLDQEIGLRQASNVNSDRICSDLCVAVAGSQTPTKVIPAYMRACPNLRIQPPIAPIDLTPWRYAYELCHARWRHPALRYLATG